MGHDSETYPPKPDTGSTSHVPETMVSPPHHSVRRKAVRSTNDPASASAPKKTRGLVTGKKVEKMCKATGDRITLTYDDFTQGVSVKELSSLTLAQIGKIVRGSVRMVAPNWESLPEDERFNVIRELSVHFNMKQRTEMLKAINTSAAMYTGDGNTISTNTTWSTAAMVSSTSFSKGKTSGIGWWGTLSPRSIREG